MCARDRHVAGWCAPCSERLEARCLLFAWSSEEVYLAELVNRARSDPSAEALRTGVDLEAELTAEEIARLAPMEPLALYEALTLASREHSEDMAVRDFFDHENPDGDRAQQRAETHGYEGSVGENIAAGYSSIDESHVAWLESVGHRRNVLSLWTTFVDDFHYDEIGVGFFFPGKPASTYGTYYTQVFGFSGRPKRTYVLGVIYDDGDGNDFYSVGEGLAGVRVDVTDAGTGALVGSYTTDGAGNYQILVDGGEYDVTFVDTATGNGVRRRITVTPDENFKIDAQGSELSDPLPPDDVSAGDGAAIVGSAGEDGTITVTTRNGEGAPIAFREEGAGAWSAADILAQAGGPTPTGQLETWTDTKDGLTYAAATSAEGLLLYKRSAEGVWSVRNLNSEITPSGELTGDITVFAGTDGIWHIAGLDTSGDLHLFTQIDEDDVDEDDFTWTARNLTTADIEASGLTMPVFEGRLISYVTAWNGQNIAGLDADGNIHTVWWAPGLTSFRVDNLSAITGAPPLTGGLTAYLTPWRGINLAGADADGLVSVTWWVPSFGGAWRTSNLSELFDGPALESSTLTSYVTSWGGLNIAGLDSFGRVVVYWWAPGLEDWSVTPLSDTIESATLPVSALRGLTVRATGSINLFGAAEDGDVLRYWWAPGGSWRVENLTESV